MTATSEILDGVLGVDSAALLDDLAHLVEFQAESTWGVDIRAMYCLYTGKRIGELDWSVLTDMIVDESSEIDDADVEAIADALVIRCVASMRPSPAMNKPDRFTLSRMAKNRPVDAIAYLINRLLGNRNLLTHRSGTASFQPLIDRIATHAKWTKLAAEGVDLSPWTHWLLELDSKMNLHDLTCPQIAKDRLGKWITVREGGDSILSLIEKSNCAELLAVFESWVFQQLEVFDERDRQATQQAKWWRGNSHTASAYVDSYLDNSNVVSRKSAAIEVLRQKKVKSRPLSEKAMQKLVQRKLAMDVLDSLLSGQLSDALETPVTQAKPKGVFFAGQFNFAKKES